MPPRSPGAGRRVLIAGAAVVFTAVSAFRWLSDAPRTTSSSRWHAPSTAPGQLPVRDFADPGQPLSYLLSAAAAWLFGATLRTDVIVTITLSSLAAIGFGWRYADSPSIRRLIALAAWTAVACLWRHDFIVYMAIPTILLLGVSHERCFAT